MQETTSCITVYFNSRNQLIIEETIEIGTEKKQITKKYKSNEYIKHNEYR